jgi:ketosteroid isomerase-like protein
MTSADSPGAAVQAYVDAFNRGDAAAMAACFAAEGSILGGMSPHLWTGPTRASDWYRDVMAQVGHVGGADYCVTLGEPEHDTVTGDAAYFVFPATMTFTLAGKPMQQSGATLTFALAREEGEWRIAAWTWSKGRTS